MHAVPTMMNTEPQQCVVVAARDGGGKVLGDADKAAGDLAGGNVGDDGPRIGSNPVGKIARRTSRAAGKLLGGGALRGEKGGGDNRAAAVSHRAEVDDDSAGVNAGGIGALPDRTTAPPRSGGRMQRRQSRGAEALSNLVTSFGIGAFSDLERELVPNRGAGSAGKTKPPPPSMAASGKQNPFRGQPYRRVDVQGKAHVLVHDDELWRDFKSELDRSGIKTGAGVKMVLLKFMAERMPGDEAATKAALEALWQRQKVEQHKSSGRMRGAISTPSLADLVGRGDASGGGGMGLLGGALRRTSHAAKPSGGPGDRQRRRRGSYGRLSFLTAQSAPVVLGNAPNDGATAKPPQGEGTGGMKRVGSNGSLSVLSIPMNLFGGGGGGGESGGGDSDESAVTFNFSASSLAGEVVRADRAAASAAAAAVAAAEERAAAELRASSTAAARRKSGFGRRRSRGSAFSLGSIGLRLEAEEEEGQVPSDLKQRAAGDGGEDEAGAASSSPDLEDDDMANAAAIVAAMGLDDDSSSDGDDEGAGRGPSNRHNPSFGDLDNDAMTQDMGTSLSQLDMVGNFDGLQAGSFDLHSSSAEGCLASPLAGPPLRYSVGYLNDLSDNNIDQVNAAPQPPPQLQQFQQKKPHSVGTLNDLSDSDDGSRSGSSGGVASSSNDAPQRSTDEQHAQDEGSFGGAGALQFRRRPRRRSSFGALSASSLGTMSVADITIEENWDEDMSSKDDGGEAVMEALRGATDEGDLRTGGDGSAADGAGGGGETRLECECGIVGGSGGIACTTVKCASLFGGAVSEYDADCSSFGNGTAMSEYAGDDGGDCDGSLGRCEEIAEVLTGYIDVEGNVNKDIAGPHDQPDSKGGAERAASEVCDDDEAEDSDDGGDFILSFPSPDERAVLRRISQEGMSDSDGEKEERADEWRCDGEDDDDDDDDNEGSMHFPSAEERETTRRSSQEGLSDSEGEKEEENDQGCNEDDSDGRSVHFPSAEERANIRRNSQQLVQERRNGEEGGDDDNVAYEGNTSAQTWSGWSTGTDDTLGDQMAELRAEVEMTTDQLGEKLFDGHKSEASLWGRRDRENGGSSGGLGWFSFRGRDADNTRASTKRTSGNDRVVTGGKVMHRRRSYASSRNETGSDRKQRHRPQKHPNNVPKEIQKIIARNQRK